MLVDRLVVAGGAGSLKNEAGERLVDSPGFVEWAYLSPAGLLEPGERTGRYRVGGDQVLVDDAGKSRITMEDFAIAMLDEAEHPRHRRQRFTVAH